MEVRDSLRLPKVISFQVLTKVAWVPPASDKVSSVVTLRGKWEAVLGAWSVQHPWRLDGER